MSLVTYYGKLIFRNYQGNKNFIERDSTCRNVKIAERQQLSAITVAFQCARQIENSNQTSKRFQSMKMGRWLRKRYARDVLKVWLKKNNI